MDDGGDKHSRRPANIFETARIWETKIESILIDIGEVIVFIQLTDFIGKSAKNEFAIAIFQNEKWFVFISGNAKIDLIQLCQFVCGKASTGFSKFVINHTCDSYAKRWKGKPIEIVVLLQILYKRKEVIYVHRELQAKKITAKEISKNLDNRLGSLRNSPLVMEFHIFCPSSAISANLSVALKSSIVFLLYKAPCETNVHGLSSKALQYRYMNIQLFFLTETKNKLTD